MLPPPTPENSLRSYSHDFSVIKAKKAPRLPLYRLEQNDELPRVIPVLGQWPLNVTDFSTVPFLSEEGEFRVVCHEGTSAWFALPGWQVVSNAEDPVAFLVKSDEFCLNIPDPVETLMVVIDRAQRQWNSDEYFVVAVESQLSVQWFDEEPTQKLLGQVILIMRPPKVNEELESQDLWHLDE